MCNNKEFKEIMKFNWPYCNRKRFSKKLKHAYDIDHNIFKIFNHNISTRDVVNKLIQPISINKILSKYSKYVNKLPNSIKYRFKSIIKRSYRYDIFDNKKSENSKFSKLFLPHKHCKEIPYLVYNPSLFKKYLSKNNTRTTKDVYKIRVCKINEIECKKFTNILFKSNSIKELKKLAHKNNFNTLCNIIYFREKYFGIGLNLNKRSLQDLMNRGLATESSNLVRKKDIIQIIYNNQILFTKIIISNYYNKNYFCLNKLPISKGFVIKINNNRICMNGNVHFIQVILKPCYERDTLHFMYNGKLKKSVKKTGIGSFMINKLKNLPKGFILSKYNNAEYIKYDGKCHNINIFPKKQVDQISFLDLYSNQIINKTFVKGKDYETNLPDSYINNNIFKLPHGFKLAGSVYLIPFDGKSHIIYIKHI